jgi:hypothetical protein
LPDCSYGPSADDRARFIRENAVQVVDECQKKIRCQAARLQQVESANTGLRNENAKLRQQLESLSGQ